MRPESKIETSSNKSQAKFLLKVWHIFALIAFVNLVFFAIASQAVGKTAEGQSVLIIAYIPIFLCRVLHKNYPNQGDNKNKIANISILLSFIYPIALHTIIIVSVLYGGMDLSSDPGGWGQAIGVFIILITILIVANSFAMINVGFLLNKFSEGSFILVIAIILFNASAIRILYL